jgi:hypothetical protein
MSNSNKYTRHSQTTKTNEILNWIILVIVLAGVSIGIYFIVDNENKKKKPHPYHPRPYPNPNPYRRCSRGYIWNPSLRRCVRKLY